MCPTNSFTSPSWLLEQLNFNTYLVWNLCEKQTNMCISWMTLYRYCFTNTALELTWKQNCEYCGRWEDFLCLAHLYKSSRKDKQTTWKCVFDMQWLLTGCSSVPLFLEPLSNPGHKAQQSWKVSYSVIRLSPGISGFSLQSHRSSSPTESQWLSNKL